MSIAKKIRVNNCDKKNMGGHPSPDTKQTEKDQHP